MICYTRDITLAGGNNTKIKQKALVAAETAHDHKAINLRILNVTSHCDYADYFIIMSATSTRHAQALASALADEFRHPTSKIEGLQSGEWVLLDLGDIVVHIFYEPMRSYYALDKIWAQAPNIEMETLEEAPAKRKASGMRAHT